MAVIGINSHKDILAGCLIDAANSTDPASHQAVKESSHGRRAIAVRFSVVVPAYRESGRIGATVAELRTALAAVHADGGVEIVVVDDGSGDGTAAAAQAAGADRVVEFKVNRGKGAAVRAGMDSSSGSVVAFTDADLAYAPEQLISLLDMVEQGADAAVGNRRHPDSAAITQPSGLRRMYSCAVGALCWALRLGHGRDTQCGFKAFSREAANRLSDASVVDRFAFDIELLHIANRLRLNVRDMPVEVVNSRTSSVRAARDGWRLVIDICRIRARSLLGRYPRHGG